MRFLFKNIFILVVVLGGMLGALPAFAAGNIDSVQKYSQFLNSNIDLDNNGVKDFINWNPTCGGTCASPVTVTDTVITGYLWGESVGWINLHPTHTTGDVWVSNSCSTGVLGGYAWGQNTGWVNFDPSHTTVGVDHPQINTTTGKITGKAWSQNYGWINLSSPETPTTTAYDPSLGLVTSWTPSGSCTPGVNGACGASNGLTFSSAPASGLCAGTASTPVATIGGWIWTCPGTGGGTTASCSASQSVCTGPGCTGGGGQSLYVTKYVVNSHGGAATPNDFVINAKSIATGVITAHPSGSNVPYNLSPGDYIVTEDPVAGYTAVYGGDCDASGKVTLPTDISKSCTVTNYDGPPPPPVSYCLNILGLTIADAGDQGYLLQADPSGHGSNCLIDHHPQYCVNDPTLTINDALATGYHTTATSTGYTCDKDPLNPTYCTNNAAVTLSDAQAAGYTIDSLGNCIHTNGTVCTNLGPNYTNIPFGYHFTTNGDCVPDTVDYCPLINGIQTSPADCPNLFPSDHGTLGTFIDNLTERGFPLKKILGIIGALGLVGGLPGAISRFGNMILTFVFGRKKWRGIVYDSDTKEPLDPVSISVIDVITGAEVASQFSDIEGRFGFVLKPGKYKIIAGKTHYGFPSVKLGGRFSDEVYDHLYFGEVFTVEDESQVVTMNIPMDPLDVDWNQQEKHRKNFFHYFMNGQTKYGWFWNALMVLGFLSSIMVTYFYPIWWNYLMTALYVVLGVMYAYGKNPISAGKVTKGGVPLSYAIMRAYNVNLNHEVARRVTSQGGGYYFLVPKGLYTITIEQKNPDGTYTKIFTSEPFKASKGMINKSFNI